MESPGRNSSARSETLRLPRRVAGTRIGPTDTEAAPPVGLQGYVPPAKAEDQVTAVTTSMRQAWNPAGPAAASWPHAGQTFQGADPHGESAAESRGRPDR